MARAPLAEINVKPFVKPGTASASFSWRLVWGTVARASRDFLYLTEALLFEVKGCSNEKKQSSNLHTVLKAGSISMPPYSGSCPKLTSILLPFSFFHELWELDVEFTFSLHTALSGIPFVKCKQ